MIAAACRGMAVAIAIAALIDPSFPMAATGRARIALMLQQPQTPVAREAHDAVARAVRREFDLAPGRDDAADALVVVGAAYRGLTVPERQRVYTVTAAPPSGEPAVRISAVRGPREAPPATKIHLEVDVDRNSAATGSSTLVVRNDVGVELARASQVWSDAHRWTASLDVPPIGLPPWHLRAEVGAALGEHEVTDNAADVLVEGSAPAHVLVFDARPSWAATFVGRALEQDPRFAVVGVSYPSRGFAVTTAGIASLSGIDLESIRAIVVGGLDQLTSRDAETLVRFMRDRGGSVILLPDALSDLRVAGRWLPVPSAAEVLVEKPARAVGEAPLPPFDVSEMLTLDASSPARALVRTSGTNVPLITIAPVGDGRIVVSGALDAWRYRSNDGAAFDRFWQAIVAGLAMSSPPAVDVDVLPRVAAPGEDVQVRVRVRRSAIASRGTDALEISGSMTGSDAPIRFWPDATPDSFHASFVAPSRTGALRVAVEAAGQVASASLAIDARARTAAPEGPPLSLLAESHRGIDVTPGRIPDLVRRLRSDIGAPTVRVERRPMRSVWWMVPFAACLSLEWWLRRRRGER
jgi:hypothetical protein